ncbi:FAD-dependent oxidoreductase [Marinobacteraceae bacterium S3BR75-40.1]
MAQQESDVIVVGGGMIGAALALGLGRAGWRVTLIDRQTPPPFMADRAPDMRVSALSAGTEALLRRLGAWAGIEGMRLAPYRRLEVWEDLRQVPLLGDSPFNHTLFDAADLKRSHLGHIVENSVTQRALWDALEPLENVVCRAPAEVVSLQATAADVTLTLAEGDTLKARLLVGADGAQSQIRTLAGIGTDSDTYAQQALVARVRHAGAPRDITWQAFFPSGPRAYLPLPADNGQAQASLVWYDAPERLDALMALDDEAFQNAIQDAFPDTLPPLQAVTGRARFPLARSHAQQYVKGRVALVGDAAHTINPLAGQGANLGFQDVSALLAQLTGATDPGAPAPLQAWARERRPANLMMMAAMDLFYYGFSNDHLPLKLARNLGLGIAGRLRPARRQVARYAMGLDSAETGALDKLLKRLKPPTPRLPIRVPFL